MRVVFVNNGTGARIWRLDPYATWLNEHGHETLLHPHGEDVTADEAEWADVAILEMVLEKKVIDLFHQNGCAVIYEIDDLIEKVTKLHPSYHKLTKATTIWRTYNCIRKSDALFASTLPIYKQYGRLKRKKDKYLFPNYLDLSFWERPYHRNESDEIRLGWAGSWAHKDDLLFISPVIARLCAKYPKLKFIYVGMGGTHTTDSFQKYIWGDDVFKEVPPEQREYHESVEPEMWPDKLANLRLDIGIAPVMDNKFSRAKSNIKFQEYAINRIPGVFSDVLYADTVISGVDGFVVKNDPQEWFDRLCYLIENREARIRLREAAYERAKRYFDIEKQYQPWCDAVTDIHARYVKRTGGKREGASGEGQTGQVQGG